MEPVLIASEIASFIGTSRYLAGALRRVSRLCHSEIGSLASTLDTQLLDNFPFPKQPMDGVLVYLLYARKH